MADCLTEAREKLGRARAHANEFTAQRLAWVADKANTDLDIGVTHKAQDGYISWFVERAGTTDLPREWSFIVGDAIHNARCVADYLAWQLVDLGSAPKPLAKPNDVQFPIVTESRNSKLTVDQFFDAQVQRRLPDIDPTHLAIIRRYQPFVARPHNPQTHPLAWLNALSNNDKHRSLRLARRLILDFSGEIGEVRHFTDTKLVQGPPLTEDDLKPGAELFRVYGTPTGTGEPKVDVNFQGQAAIVFTETPMKQVAVGGALDAVNNVLANLLDEFDRIL